MLVFVSILISMLQHIVDINRSNRLSIGVMSQINVLNLNQVKN